MEISFERESLRYFERLYSSAFTHEETTEVIVPDAMPDAAGILTVEGTALLRAKEADPDLLKVSGVCDISVLYLPEEGGQVRRLGLEAPFDAAAPCPGLTELGRPVVSVRLVNADARILNSRKLLIRTEVCVTAGVWMPKQLEWNSGCKASGGVEVLTREYTVMPVTDVTEKTFSAEETLELPGSRPAPGELLSSRVSLRTEEVNALGAKLILRGTALADVLYLSPQGEAADAQLQLPWSVILETEDGEGERRCDAVTALTGFRVSLGEDGSLTVELGAVAQGVVRSRRTLKCVADAYGIRERLEVRTRAQTLETGGETVSAGETLRLTLDHSRPVRSVLRASAWVGRPRQENGTYVAPVTAKAVCTGENGALTALTGRGEAVCTGPCGAVPDAEAGEVYGTAAAAGAELRIPVHFRCPVWETAEVTLLEGADSAGEGEAAGPEPAVSVILTREGDSVWSLGKENRASCGGIRRLNGLEGDAEPAPGSLILVARQR